MNSYDNIAAKISLWVGIDAGPIRAWLVGDREVWNIEAIEAEIYDALSLYQDEDALVRLHYLGVISDKDLRWMSS